MKKVYIILILVLLINVTGFKAIRYKCPCRKWGIQCTWVSKTKYKYCPNCLKSGHKIRLRRW